MQVFKNNLSIGRFFVSIFLIAAGLTFLIAGLIFVVDPYAIWRHQAIQRINEIKLETTSASQVGTAVLRSAVHPPDVLILGSSRVRRGFNETFASQLYRSSVQVAGINALQLSNIKDLFSTFRQRAQIKKLYLEVNYFTSNACTLKNEALANKSDLADPLHYFSPQDAIVHSLRTLKINLFPLRSFDNYFDVQGRYHDDPSEGMSRTGGMETYESRYNRLFQSMTNRCQRQASNAADTKDLSDIIRLAQARQTEIILLILPVSARWQTRIQQGGLSPKVTQWKKNIILVASQFHVPVLDYEEHSDVNALAENSNHAMPMFWDETHFSNRLGDYILRDMQYASHVATIHNNRQGSLTPQP